MKKKQEHPPGKGIEKEEERLETALPFKEYERDAHKLRLQIQKLEKEYDEREKVINQIMEYGTGIESEKALRMYSTAVLRKWEESLESRRGRALKQ